MGKLLKKKKHGWRLKDSDVNESSYSYSALKCLGVVQSTENEMLCLLGPHENKLICLSSQTVLFCLIRKM